jgi:hypothetical protein
MRVIRRALFYVYMTIVVFFMAFVLCGHGGATQSVEPKKRFIRPYIPEVHPDYFFNQQMERSGMRHYKPMPRKAEDGRPVTS